MKIVKTVCELREELKEVRKQGKTIGLVPTMGALHIGHESLIAEARKQTDVVVVSIFVNPTQFGPNEDYDKYPRTLDADAELCQKHHVDFIFAPEPHEVYSDTSILTSIVPPESYQNKLCGETRIGHFNGVALIVAKLFNIVQPDRAFFGQKDAQQLAIIKKMVKDLNFPIEIISCPIIRQPNGLACSSRNSYLTEIQKEQALSLSKVVKDVEAQYLAGEKSINIAKEKALSLLDDAFTLDYLEIYNADTMEEISELQPNSLVAIAAKIGDDGKIIRLIDNVILK